MSKPYQYIVEGIDSDNNKWGVSGYIDAEPGDIFGKAWQVIGAEVITQLRNGKAAPGKPGQMCKGPFTVQMLCLEERK